MRALRGWCVVPFLLAAACGDNSGSNVDAAGPDGPPRPQCSDDVDNDGDGKTDYPNDPGCIATLVDDESDPCPEGAGCPQCGDGLDNDGNGKADFPEDTGCTSAADVIEFTDDPNACGQGMVIKPLPLNGMDAGTLNGTLSNVSSPCGGGNGVPGIAYVFHLATPRVVVATTDDPMTVIDSVLDLRSSMCATPGAELACHDDVATATNKRSQIVKPLNAGTYYLIVQGKTAADNGMYSLNVQFHPGQGALCMTDQDCGPGLECRVPANQTQKQCTGPVCNDGIDDDTDGKTDYPHDPGCASPTDTSEQDVCAMAPQSPQCPQCANGLDDDADGNTDFPADTSCVSAGTLSEACQQSEAVIVATSPTTTGTTVGATNDFRPPPGSVNNHLCSTTVDSSATAPDVTVQIDLPAMDSLAVNLDPAGFDSSHSLFSASCSGAPIDCSDNPIGVTATNLARGRYYVIVDGYSSGSGTFTMKVTGNIKAGESCESPLAAPGGITCGTGTSCQGTPGSRTCMPTQCADMIDNNTDGKTDFPADPGCSSPSDTTENTVCPGTMCPACADGLDNDNDGFTDYPTDTSCFSASATNEACSQSESIGVITQMTTTGTTVNATNDSTPTCGSSTHTAKDLAYQLDVPAMATLNLNLTGFDTAHSLLDSTCGGTPIACSDPALMTRTNVPAGRYYVVVDGWGTGNGAFTLTTTGTVAPNASCEGALFQSGAFTCTAGYACTGTVGSRTCTPAQCNDGLDNNGDGKTDFPADPGCSSTSDSSENTVCPGTSCPVCADGLDNDTDGLTDYPADTSCAAASSSSETCAQSETIGVISTKLTTGTTANATNDFTPTCGSSTHTAKDLAYQLDVPAMATLNLDLSGFDGAHSLLDASCAGTAIACSDPNLMTRTNVPAGRYYVIVDGWGSGSGAFTLTTTGTVAPNASCEGALFQAGAFTCTPGYSCSGAVGSRTCTPGACNDTIDNDGDGKSDYPSDPGCGSTSDTSEADDCSPTVGPSCPACGNGLDDDMDTFVDYPNDTRCPSASFFLEAFCPMEADIGGMVVTRTTTGTLANGANNFTQSCQATTGNDASFGLRLPVPVASLQIDTIGSVASDTVVSLWNAPCMMSLGCDDDGDPASNRSLLTVTNVPAGDYAIQVDSYSTSNNLDITLNVVGTVAAGTACTSELFASGVLVCPMGTTCTSGSCQ